MRNSAMMHDFTDKWEEISGAGHAAGRFRIAPDHILNLYISYTIAGRREFTLETDDDVFEQNELPEFENILIQAVASNDSHTLNLTLADASLNDLFSVICYDLVDASSRALSVAGAVQIFASRLNRWSELLKQRRTHGMSLQERIGLIGELMLVDWLIQDGAVEKGTVVRAWRGPDGDSKDIGLNSTRIEIKAQLSTRPAVLKISSLDQLDGDGRGLCVVLHRLTPSDNGVSLANLADYIGNLLARTHDGYREFQRKLYLTGYDPSASYANDMFLLDVRRIFLVGEDFPRLIPRNVPAGITKATYEIDCSAIEGFEIESGGLLELIHGTS